MNAILVGLCGPAGCGKSTVGNVMEREFLFTQHAFAAPIKRGLNAMFHWEMQQWDNRAWKESTIDWIGKSPRQLIQTLGTEWGRDLIAPDLWIRIAMRRWGEVRASHSPRMVITDVRFDNEAQAIIDAGGSIWRVEREQVTPVTGHVTEKGISPVLVTGRIRNQGTIADLEFTIFDLMQTLRKRYAT